MCTILSSLQGPRALPSITLGSWYLIMIYNLTMGAKVFSRMRSCHICLFLGPFLVASYYSHLCVMFFPCTVFLWRELVLARYAS